MKICSLETFFTILVRYSYIGHINLDTGMDYKIGSLVIVS